MIELTVYIGALDIKGVWSTTGQFVATVNPHNIEMFNTSISGDPRTVVYFSSGKTINVKEDPLTITQRIELSKKLSSKKK